jgi:peroxiredoxin
MEKNEIFNEVNWVDAKLATLDPPDGWLPDTLRARAQFNARLGKERSSGAGPVPSSTAKPTRRVWPVGAALAAAACLCLLAFPESRDLIQYLRVDNSRPVDMGQVSADLNGLKFGEAPPDFDLRDTDGLDLRLLNYRGKVILLNFWATWCRGCQTEIPWLVDFENQYGKSGLQVIGISMDDGGWKLVSQYLDANNLNYPVVIGNGDLADKYDVSAMPMTILIGRNGKIAGVSAGVIDRETAEQQIQKLLKE